MKIDFDFNIKWILMYGDETFHMETKYVPRVGEDLKLSVTSYGDSDEDLSYEIISKVISVNHAVDHSFIGENTMKTCVVVE